jgi:hypothetical protein
MGTWASGIFADDDAADIRGDWREAIIEGTTPEAATEGLQTKYRSRLADNDLRPLFWMALAAAQHETGRLLPEVRDRALSEISAGGDVKRFAEDDPALGRQRQAVIDRLAEKLRGPEKSPVRLRRAKPKETDLRVGDVLSVRGLTTDRRVIFAVVGIAAGWPPGTTWPVVAPLRWVEDGLPPIDVIPKLPRLIGPPALGEKPRPVLFVQPESKRFGGWRDFAELIARGVVRRDLPDPPREKKQPWNAAYGSWESTAIWVDHWFDNAVEMTDAERSTQSIAQKAISRLRGRP